MYKRASRQVQPRAEATTALHQRIPPHRMEARTNRSVHNPLGLLLPSVAAACSLSTACAIFDMSSINDKAIRTERMQCEAQSSAGDRSIIASATVLEVGAQYSSHTSGVSQVFATRIVMRPPEGVSVDRMTRVLQCHTARQTLGRADDAPIANDPFYLPNTWLTINVREEDGNFVAVIGADTTDQNLTELRRAKAYAAARAPAPTPPTSKPGSGAADSNARARGPVETDR